MDRSKFIEKIKYKKIMLFGAGGLGRSIKSYLFEKKINILNFIDNDTNKWGTPVDGIEVLSPKEAFNRDFDYILVTSMFAYDIYQQIKNHVETDKIIVIPINHASQFQEESWNYNNKETLLYNEREFKQNRKIVEKRIKICFIFQIASYWNSLDSLYQACLEDERIEIRVFLYSQDIHERTQTKTAETFLQSNDISYTRFTDEELNKFDPHIIILQSPNDYDHRDREVWASSLKTRGYRVLYIPYGIEISDTRTSQEVHFNNNVVLNAWRVYTLSERMADDYRKHSMIRFYEIKGLGSPKFDAIHNFKRTENNKYQTTKAKAKGKQIVLWKAHFPKEFIENGRAVMCTPFLKEYRQFLESMKAYPNLYFIFMPHPKFKEIAYYVRDGSEFLMELESYSRRKDNNLYIYEDDDYVPGLMVADYIMVDRSAIMVEAAATGRPVLYLRNEGYDEPVTDAIKELMSSYYQGTGCRDMKDFINMCLEGVDPKEKERKKAFEKCVPNYDGQAGYRIKEDIIASILSEE